ncbi:AhpC/TSA family protein [Mucilaginibacter yixingensis]|uniref:AhpC/TSA family protein n=1 Tax=Mucilaginibacter yixingensis TaxID=1295612 RepID=A0A2T5JFF0_9SPHI|nr:redoxin domain-containing protein [Mucilaginibacter yixingensis]PTR01157.1 AhpC/TSA family protein [Mucilaginibacter yixingensis]
MGIRICIALLCFVFICPFYGFSQKKALPPLHLTNLEGKPFTENNLQKNKKLLVIYFGPDCMACNYYTIDLMRYIKELANVQILMVSFARLPALKAFYNDLQLVKYKNITITNEAKPYPLSKFYEVKTTPFTAVYNKRHQLVTVFNKRTKLDVLLKALNKPL